MVDRLFHLLTPDEWAAARGSGEIRPPSLAAEGFVHLSFADQLLGSAGRHFADVPQLLALEIDSAPLGGSLRLEDTYGTGVDFPHVYAPVSCAHVLAVYDLVRDPDGRWSFSDAASAPASPDR